VRAFTELLSAGQSAALDQIRACCADRRWRAYVVGGALRDWLLGSAAVTDLDIAIDGDACALARASQARHGGEITLHTRFNTATWLTGGEAIDLAMTRAERYARPAALPEVRHAPIEEDLGRRDFSINAIALNLDDIGDAGASLIDPYHGRQDLNQRVLRVLHGASFEDDPTRLLRGARYASRLAFDLTPETESLARASVTRLRDVSGERLKSDFELIFGDARPARALALLAGWGVFRALGVPVPDDGTLDARLARVAEVLRGDSFAPASLGHTQSELLAIAGWGALLYHQGQFAASQWLGRIPFESAPRDALAAIGPLSSLDARLFDQPVSRQSGLLSVFDGLTLLLGFLFDPAHAKRNAMYREWHEWRRVRPITTGDDLIARKVPPGRNYKTILDTLRAAWLDNVIGSADEEQRLLEALLRDLAV
jgi:tRNA nucleotidyltransferase (CCA-adding enzyme)